MEQRALEMHPTRARTVKPLVTAGVPPLEHLRNNPKGQQMLEERYSEIDRDNRILLQKMTDIMRPPVAPRAPSRPLGPTSLNRAVRKNEILRIARENQRIVRKIQAAKPDHYHTDWKEDRWRKISSLNSGAEYPLAMRSARGRSSELVPLRGADEEQRPQSAREHRPRSGRSTSRPVGGGDSIDPPIAREQQWVLKEGKLINGTYYLVEMATDGQTLSITAYDGETRTNLELVLKEPAFQKLYRETSGDYSMMAQRLAVKGGKLTVVDAGAKPSSTPAAPTPTSRGGRNVPDEMDAEAMVVNRTKSGSG
mmetsp:Transcript_20785/g.47332  ORF Transcript_20785/g.47332 Transcript_20785/m.47332 type:complete len:309 (-) Transcript_20785:253-1179(-)